MARYKWIFLGLLFLTLSACQPSEAQPTTPLPTATKSPPPAVNTPTTIPEPSATPIEPATSTPTSSQIAEETPTTKETRNSAPQNIASGEISVLWWSPDSKTLFYGVHLEGNFAYELENGSIQKLAVAEVLQQTPTPDILTQLPPYYFLGVYVSPSGNRAIYVNQADSPPIPTIDPAIEGGESGEDSHQLDLWLWEDNASRLLGNPLQCHLDESFWTPDEKKVVLVEANIPMVFCPIEAQAWLLDLENDTYTPLFPPLDFFNLRVFGYSPNGNQLLVGFSSYETGENLHFLDVNTLNLTPIDAPVDRFIQWINEDNILVKYRGDLSSAPYPVGVFNLQTLEFTEILPMFNDKYVENVSLSSDQKWIAFSTGGGYFYQNKVWLMEFELPDP